MHIVTYPSKERKFEILIMKTGQNIPESLTARLLNVVVLDLHSNQLKSLPNSIGCLKKLKVLNAAGNLLSFLPKTIENCRSVLLFSSYVHLFSAYIEYNYVI